MEIPLKGAVDKVVKTVKSNLPVSDQTVETRPETLSEPQLKRAADKGGVPGIIAQNRLDTLKEEREKFHEG